MQISTLAAIGLATAPSAVAAAGAERLARIGPRMKAFVEQGRAAGIVTLIGHRGKVVHLDAQGYLKLEDKIPMKTGTIFEIMSMTRPVTATIPAIYSGDTLTGAAGWGLGWSVAQNNGGRLDLRSLDAYGHAGAFGTFGWVDPVRQLVGVFMIQGGPRNPAMRLSKWQMPRSNK